MAGGFYYDGETTPQVRRMLLIHWGKGVVRCVPGDGPTCVGYVVGFNFGSAIDCGQRSGCSGP